MGGGGGHACWGVAGDLAGRAAPRSRPGPSRRCTRRWRRRAPVPARPRRPSRRASAGSAASGARAGRSGAGRGAEEGSVGPSAKGGVRWRRLDPGWATPPQPVWSAGFAELVAQGAAVELLHRGEGQRVDHARWPRAACRRRGDRRRRSGGRRGVGAVRPGCGDDHGHADLAHDLVATGDHGDVGDRRVRRQHRLDLERVDVVAAADEHLLGAAGQAEQAPLVDQGRGRRCGASRRAAPRRCASGSFQ